MTGDRLVLNVGDHVRVASLVGRKPKNRPSPAATGVIRGFTERGVTVDLDTRVNGATWCTAGYGELTVIA